MDSLVNFLSMEWVGAPVGIWLGMMALVVLFALVLVISRVPLRICRKTKDGNKIGEFEIATTPYPTSQTKHLKRERGV